MFYSALTRKGKKCIIDGKGTTEMFLSLSMNSSMIKDMPNSRAIRT